MDDRPLIVGIALVAGLAGAPERTPARAERPQLSGRWVLNVEESDDAREVLRRAGDGRDASAGGGRMPRGSGGGGAGGRGTRGGPPGGGRPPGGPREDLRAVLDAPSEMTITHTEAEIAVLETDGRLRALHPDGRSYRTAAGAEVETRWDGERLVVETRPDDGPKLVETFTIESDPRRLVVSIALRPPSGDPVTVRRVYDAAPAE